MAPRKSSGTETPAGQPAAGAGAAPHAGPPDDESEERQIHLLTLSLVAVFVGLFTGFGAIAFRALIGVIHNVFFLGVFSFQYDANVFTPTSPWGPLVILVPVIGGLGVTFLVKNFAPEARGHGVPEVMDAIYYQRGHHPADRGRREIAGIGTVDRVRSGGGTRRPDHPDRRLLRLDRRPDLPIAAWQRITLVAAGAGAGIAATFNTPLGGVMFAIELMMPEVSVAYLPARCAGDRHGDLHRTHVPGSAACLPGAPDRTAQRADHDRDRAAALRGARRRDRPGGDRVHPRPALGRTQVRGDRQSLPPPYCRHGDHRRNDVCAEARLRPILHRWGRLRRSRAGPGWAILDHLSAAAAVRVQTVRDLREPWFGRVRRHFLAVPVHGRDSGRRVRRDRLGHRSRRGTERPQLRHGRHGGDGRRRHRRGDDRRHHDLRDDARLRHRRAADPGGRRAPSGSGECCRARTSTRSSWSAAATSFPRPCTPICSWCATPPT